MHIACGDDVVGIKRHCRNLSGDGVKKMTTASDVANLKEDLESSTWRRRQDFNATPEMNPSFSSSFLGKRECVERISSLLVKSYETPHHEITEQDVESLRARVEAAEQRADIL
ncbi:hypothetical protein Tco_0439614 [Tanacetum coccineum]